MRYGLLFFILGLLVHALRAEPHHPPEGSRTTVVAVIDNGIFSDDPELRDLLLPGYDMMSTNLGTRNGRTPNSTPDKNITLCVQNLKRILPTHGTEVARVLAMNAPKEVSILPIRVTDGCNTGRKDLLDALRWAAGLRVDGLADNPNPAKIINLSIAGGRSVCGEDLQSVIDTLNTRKVFVVAAAGNYFHRGLMEPANCKRVISVGAVNVNLEISKYSSLDERIDLYAFGGNRKLLDSPDTNVGTSFSAPIVAGYLAKWISKNQNSGVEDFRSSIPQLSNVIPIVPLECQNCVVWALNSPLLSGETHTANTFSE